MTKIRSLQVRPIQSSDLSFDVPGVLGNQNQTSAKLGARVTRFDVGAFIATFGTVDGAGRMVFNSQKIRTDLSSANLFSLRNELPEANVEQAIAQRELSVMEKYKHRTRIAAAMRKVYPDDSTAAAAKLKRLEDLKRLSTQQMMALKAAYENTQSNGVISDSITTTRNTGAVTSLTLLTPVAMKNTAHRIEVRDSPANSNHNIGESQVIPQAFATNKWKDIETAELAFPSQKTTSTNDLTHVSSTRNTEFRHPFLENLIQDLRSQINLQDELLMNETFSFRVPEIEAIIGKELEAIDWEVRKAQIRYAQTFLVAPISGIVTAIYKDVGETVQPGEPVLRIENDEKVLLVGIVQHRGLLKVGNTVRVRTGNLYEGGASNTPKTEFTGPIVAVRGHDADDDEWDLIIECDNTNRALPINYHFDRDTTEFVIA
jgi:hypothetical protein